MGGQIASKEALLAKRADTASGFPEDEVEVPGFGVVRVRALNRLEVIHLQAAKGPAAVEQRTIALGMVEPAMTEDDVKQWQRVSTGGELNPITERIGQLSGMMPGADKDAYKSVRDESEPGVRVLPGGEDVDAGVPAAGGVE